MKKLFIFFCIFILTNQTAVFGEITRSKSGMVVTAHPAASQIGIDILNAGGNAVDAAAAVIFALSIVEPWASGIGGGGIMLVKMGDTSLPVVIDYRERAPLSASPEMLDVEDDSITYRTYTGYKSICVPGAIAGVDAVHSKFGKLTIKEVLDPVIRLAREGFEVSQNFTKLLFKYYDLIEMNRSTSLIFLPDWYPLYTGQRLTREDLAVTMEILSLRGLSDFYQGRMAVDIAHDIQRNDGLLSIMDLNQYRTMERKPLRGFYRGYEIITTPAPGSGGTALLQLLSILEDFNMQQHAFNSGEYIHIFTEALKLVLADREKYNGDPDYVAIHSETYVSDDYTSSMRKKIDVKHARSANFTYLSGRENGNASHVSIVDRHGNSVALTGTNNFYFGSAVSHPKYGILFNNGLYNFSQDAEGRNSLAPGKRSASSMTPTILLKEGVPCLNIGSSGGARTFAALAHIICAVLDYNMNIGDAVSAPRFFYDSGSVQMETRLDSEAIDRMKQFGHKVKLRIDYDTYFGIAGGIFVDPLTGIMSGAADPRGEGSAEGL